jgi:hypothetical protein
MRRARDGRSVGSGGNKRKEGQMAQTAHDIRLLYHDRTLCGAGDHRHSVSLDPRELLRIAEPQVADICERIPGPHDTGFGELPQP